MTTGTTPFIAYDVPGLKTVLAQAGPMTCWATVYTMMICWKTQTAIPTRDAVAAVGARYATLYDAGLRTSNPHGMPSAEFATFLSLAHMAHEPMVNLDIPTWLEKLQRYGLLWIGSLNGIGPGAGLHSRIIEGMRGDQTLTGTYFKIIDPAGGTEYSERFDTFLAK